MTEIYFVRHGQSVSNLNGIFAGHTDPPLTELGTMQAKATAKFFDSIKPDIVYASPLLRAYHTGLEIAERFSIPIKTDLRLREIYAGEWEGKTFDCIDTEYKDAFHIWKTDIGNAVCTNGESVAELMERVSCAVEEIVSENPGKKIVFAVHATPVRVMECYISHLPLSEMKNITWITNASVTCAVHDGKELKITKRADDSHLGKLRTEFPANV